MICSTFMENWPNRNTIDTNLIQTWSRLCQIILNAWILYINKNNLKFKNVSTSVLSATWHSTSTPQQQRFEMLGHGISTTKRPRWRWSPRLWWRRLSLLDYSCREWSSAEDEERKAKFTRGQHPTQLQGDWVDGANPPSPTMSQNPRRRMCIPIRGMCHCWPSMWWRPRRMSSFRTSRTTWSRMMMTRWSSEKPLSWNRVVWKVEVSAEHSSYIKWILPWI